MKTSLLYFILSIAVFVVPACCNCDDPEVYRISSDDLSILPADPDKDSIKYRNSKGNLYYANSDQNCDEDRIQDCGTRSGRGIGCNCPDSKDDMCEYNLYISDAHHFSISLIRNSHGLSTRFVLNGKPIKQTNTLSSYTFRNHQYNNVMVFEYADAGTRVAVDVNGEVTDKTLYAPGHGLLQMIATDGQVVKLAQ